MPLPATATCELPSPDGVVVVIPARDEAPRVGAAVRAVARSLLRVPLRQRLIVVVDDASRDGTGDAALAALRHAGVEGVVRRTAAGTAGAARQAGLVDALTHLRTPPERTWVLSTDADSVVPPSWVGQHLAHGALAVAGIVSLLPDRDRAVVADVWARDYGPTIAADGTHPHVHAANLSVRLAELLAVGGFPPVDRAEDRALWKRLREHGVDPVADAGIVVATSARTRGRVPRGFAHALQGLLGVAHG